MVFINEEKSAKKTDNAPIIVKTQIIMISTICFTFFLVI